MGGLLQSKKSLSDWEAIEKEEVWKSSQNYILPSLFLSYQHLPSLSLKQCFAYCATFPKDHIMEKNELIDLWIAQGFLTIHGTSNSTSKMEKMGEDYFKALLNISFLQLEEGHWTEHNTEKEIWKCKMHDLVHDLAIHIFEKELFIWDAKADTSFTVFNCRHLVLFDFTEEKSKPLKEEIIQQVRTMNIWSGKCPSWNVLTQARCLRTLIIVNKGITEVPPTIGKLKHLRYLDLSSNPIEILPDSICKLYQLQALILWETRLQELPKELCKLINLRRLTISDCVCQHLPINDFGRLPNLRGLCLCKMPEVETVGEEVNGNGNENNHVNESLDITNKGKYIDGSSIENEFFPVLRELRIRGFKRLRKLNLLPPANATTVAVPFPCLEVLEIAECPRLEVVETSPALSFESLKSLFLYDNIESEEPLNIIKYHKSGSLTSLIATYMQKMKSLPQSLSNCPRLETFCLDDCPKLVCLPCGVSSLVSLKHLKLYRCTALVSLPNYMFHGSSLSSLCELYIGFCSNLVSLPDDMFKGLSSLLTLTIYYCERLEKIPTSVTECTSLEKLQIYDCKSLKHPIPDLSKLQGLVELKIRDITSSMLEWIPHLPHLRYIEADVEHEIESKDNSPSTRCLSYLTVFCNDNHHTITPPPHKPNNSLKQLGLFERSKNKQQKMKSLPQQLLQLHLPNLKNLGLIAFEELERLPEWIGTLSSLEQLDLWECKKLRHLPAKKHLPQNLKTINIYSCPILKERLSAKEDSGSEWHKISHVPFICIDHEIIQDHRKF